MLDQLILDLYEKVNQEKPSTETITLIGNLLEENDLHIPSKVPDWFVHLLKQVLSQRETQRTSYEHYKGQGDISNFLAELEDVIVADWNDYGEAVEVCFSNLNLKATISSEGNFYEVVRL